MPSDNNESRLNRYKARLTDEITDSEVGYRTPVERHNLYDIVNIPNLGSKIAFETSSNSTSNISTSSTDTDWKCGQLMEAAKQRKT